MLPPITNDDVVAIAPKLAVLTDGAWQTILNYVNEIDFTSISSGGAWGWSSAAVATPAEVRLARILLAAHFGETTRLASTGSAGPVISETAGALRRTYGFYHVNKMNVFWLDTTQYGQQFLAILSMSNTHGPLTI